MDPLTRVIIQAGYLVAKEIPKSLDKINRSNEPSSKESSTIVTYEVISVSCPNCGHINRKSTKWSPSNYKCSSCGKCFDKEKDNERCLKAQQRANEQEDLRNKKTAIKITFAFLIVFGLSIGIFFSTHH